MDRSPPGSSVHGLLQARILEWVAISSSRGSSPTQGLSPRLLCLLCWQAGSLPPAPKQRRFVRRKVPRAGVRQGLLGIAPGCSSDLPSGGLLGKEAQHVDCPESPKTHRGPSQGRFGPLPLLTCPERGTASVATGTTEAPHQALPPRHRLRGGAQPGSIPGADPLSEPSSRSRHPLDLAFLSGASLWAPPRIPRGPQGPLTLLVLRIGSWVPLAPIDPGPLCSQTDSSCPSLLRDLSGSQDPDRVGRAEGLLPKEHEPQPSGRLVSQMVDGVGETEGGGLWDPRRFL
ncbi:unnamed protein product [Rangifer tarandus platyrhynchus]|uniref:Uncharacterized protein n=2 Tax=Rangifer tarandus platyrhynchus TaxID=3082113 RepID=A0AC59Y4D0_RANTA|nr:unnamed protein product [Rangifer tarandus platyrhynchus]